jgi:hypothetical protein
MQTIEYARRWIGMGYSPIPIAWASKVPVKGVRWTHWRENLPPRMLVEAWWRQEPRNMAVVLSRGLTVLDFDDREIFHGWYEKTRIESLTVSTGRGFHVYLKLDEALMSTAKMIGGDIKATGYVVFPRSRHPDGWDYEIVRDTEILTLPNIEAAGVEVLELYNPMSFDDQPRRHSEGEGVIAKINRYLRVTDLLQGAGVQLQHAGRQLICRCPFHDDRNPSLGIYDDNTVYCFTTNCRAHRHVDALGLFALLNRISVQDAIRILAKQI